MGRHPNATARACHQAARNVLALADHTEQLAAKVIAAHRAGNHTSAYVIRGRRDELDRALLEAHQRAALAYGEVTFRRALTAERHRHDHGKAA